MVTRVKLNPPTGVKLNKEQRKAVEFDKGPLLIIAGAGTGKTTVVTERIKYLVSSGKAKPSEILALTFTEKAAREMEERVDMAMPYGFVQMWISTFHSFCDKILRLEGINIGLSPGYNLMTQAETIQFLKNNIFKFNLDYFRPLGNPNKFIEGMIKHFSRLKDEDVDAQAYQTWVKKRMVAGGANLPAGRQGYHPTGVKSDKEDIEKYMELAGAYKVYEGIKEEEGLADFSDLIANALKLFRNRKNILEKYKKQFRYVLVDEFQDTNYAQYVLLKLLAPPRSGANLTVVGDDSQAVYRFRGAAISNILQFMKEYKNAKQIILTENYRSTQVILDSAHKLIKNNDPDTLEVRLGISKDLRAISKRKNIPIDCIYADRVENEADKVIKEVKKLGMEYQWKDFAILVRANNHAEPFTAALNRVGIPYQFLGPGMLFKQPEIKDLIAYLKFLANIDDSQALYRVMVMEIWEISGRDISTIMAMVKSARLNLYEALEKTDKMYISQKSKETIEKIKAMVARHLDLIPKQTAGQILYYFLEDSGLLRQLTDFKTTADEKRAKNIARLFEKLKNYEGSHEDSSVYAVSDWIDLSMQLGESPLAADFDWFDNNAVNIMTVHSAKGLEFPVVFLVNLVAERFPSRDRSDQIPIPDDLVKEILPQGDSHLQEERRLFYVGMTRAKDLLYLTAANYYGEGKREKKISPFVFEALGKFPDKIGEENKAQMTLFDWRPLEEEIDRPINKEIIVDRLSFSKIDDFGKCPLKYRYKYIQNIPSLSSAALSFGETIHKTLQNFYLSLKAGQKVTLEKLSEIYEENWIPVGYSNKSHQEKMKESGKKILDNFFRQANTDNLPIALEDIFWVKVTDDLSVNGKIDRVDFSNGRYEIIDYKTGKTGNQKDADKSLQLTIYALAALGKYKGISPDNLLLGFYYLDENVKIKTKRTTAQLEAAKKEIINKAKEISQSNFAPKPGLMCDFCEYKLICEAWR